MHASSSSSSSFTFIAAIIIDRTAAITSHETTVKIDSSDEPATSRGVHKTRSSDANGSSTRGDSSATESSADALGTGDNYIRVKVWNPTVANLTLLALGSSAPEILLAIYETMSTLGGSPGELGASTIVGSASFNLFVITAICIVAIPSNTTKSISKLGVFVLYEHYTRTHATIYSTMLPRGFHTHAHGDRLTEFRRSCLRASRSERAYKQSHTVSIYLSEPRSRASSRTC